MTNVILTYEQLKDDAQKIKEKLVENKILNPFSEIEIIYFYSELKIHTANTPAFRSIIKEFGYKVSGIGYGANPHSFGQFTEAFTSIEKMKEYQTELFTG